MVGSTLYTEIGERIRLERLRLRLSQAELGKRLGVTHAAVSDIERAQTRPDLDYLAEIAEALDVPLGDLVVLSRPSPTPPLREGG